MKERLNSLLNNSSTKQAYSFGKVIRFKKIKEKMIYLNFIIFLKKEVYTFNNIRLWKKMGI